MMNGTNTSEAVKNVFHLQNRVKMADGRLLLHNEHWVWDRSSHEEIEELEEKRGNHRGGCQG